MNHFLSLKPSHFFPIFLSLLLFSSCDNNQNGQEIINSAVSKKDTIEENATLPDNSMDVGESYDTRPDSSYPEYVNRLHLPDSFLLDRDHSLFGDFNADGKEDFACKVINTNNGYAGVLIIHNKEDEEYRVFGAGNEVNGMKNLDWIEVFKVIPQGETIAPTLVDEETGEIIGPDSTREFLLKGEAIFMHLDGACGGGIIFHNGEAYDWYHLE